MAQNLIKWTKRDYNRLRYAVKKFNNTIQKLENIENKSYLPNIKNYVDVKKRIVSRNELNRVLKELKGFNEETAVKVTTQGGQELSRWEYKQLRRARQRALNNLAKEEGQIVLGQRSIGMGDERLREIEATRKSLEKLDVKKGDEFNRIAKRLEFVGRKDYKLAQDLMFRDNFYKALEELKDYENYDLLVKHLSKIKNPTKFYEYVRDNSTILSDIFKWYKDEQGSLIYGGFASNQEAFNTALEKDFGIDIPLE